MELNRVNCCVQSWLQFDILSCNGMSRHINQINLSIRALDKRVCDIWHDWVSSIPTARNSYYVLIAFYAWADNSERGSLLKRVGFFKVRLNYCKNMLDAMTVLVKVCLPSTAFALPGRHYSGVSNTWIIESLSVDLTCCDSVFDFSPIVNTV